MITRYRTAALVLGGLLLAVWLAPLGRAEEINPSVRLDGAPLKMDAPAILDVAAGRTLVPVRFVAEPLGYSIAWDEQTQTVFAERNGRTVEFRIGSRSALVNGMPVTLSVAPRLVKDRALVPLRFFAELADADVSWDEKTRSIDITSPTSRLSYPDASWVQPQGGVRRTAYNDGATFGSKAIPMWEHPVSLDAWWDPISPVTVGEGLAFVAGDREAFRALNRENGEAVWSLPISGSSSPVYDAARAAVYVTDASKLYALDAATGAERWFAAIASEAQPLLIGNQVLVNTAQEGNRGTLTSYDADTGSKLWQARVQGAGVPAAFGARLFLADDYGGVYAYRSMDGSPLWSRPGDRKEREYGRTDLMVDHGRVYFAAGQRLIALDEATGKLIWERREMPLQSGMASDGTRLWIAVGDGLNVLDAETGELLRYPAICRTTPSAPVISRSHAFLTCDGSIFAVSRDSYDAARVGAGRGP
ncbi:MAG TPA: stalk domain-containing protein, partial [Symbiobacteriaceae bacterium]|nr:stalk domain-containing protein [Symbiobacteriaceae bacterium]